jgi:hypothetical protein
MSREDEMSFVIETYGDTIKKVLKTTDLSASFFASSEEYVDKVEPIKVPSLRFKSNSIDTEGPTFKPTVFSVTIYQDFSVGKNLLTDCNICTLKTADKELTFLKFITPFTRTRAYDFIVSKSNEIEEILKELNIREEKANFEIFDFPIIGIDFSLLKKETIDFLLNEDFREYCRKHRIQLKRGIVLEGKPGVGKTLSLRWLKEQALKNKITFINFKDPKEFLDGHNSYYENGKKIFVFEDFDQLLRERKDVDNSPNVILAKVLNTLEGVNAVHDVVSVFTTNKIDLFDEAFLRPGRIDKIISYKLPSEEDMFNFFKSYIPEHEEFFDRMTVLLRGKNCDISYAILKGICDDINIFVFNKQVITFDDVMQIMADKLKGAMKNKCVEDTKKFIL